MYAPCSIFTHSLNLVLAASFMIICYSLHVSGSVTFLVQLVSHSFFPFFLVLHYSHSHISADFFCPLMSAFHPLYSFTESCACCFIHDHLLLASCIWLSYIPCSTCFSFVFPLFSCPALFSFIHLSRFLLLIDVSLSPHLLSSLIQFTYFPGMSGTGHGHLMSIFALHFPVHSSWH